MCIFLCLGYARLRFAICCKVLAKSVGQRNLFKCHRLVRDRHIILGETYIGGGNPSTLSLKTGKIITAECAGNLPCAVRAEIVENNGVAVLNGRNRRAVLLNHGRHNKLVRHILLVGISHCHNRACCLIPLAVNHRRICLLNTVPAVVTIHHIVAPHHGRHLANADFLHLRIELLQKLFAGSRCGIAPVKESVHINFL